jgi:hypothetical protein
MPCFGPLTAYYPKQGANDKRLVFDKRKSNSGVAISVPCGQCIGCKLERSRQWAVRCMHELRMHGQDGSSFLTLTYDNKHLPAGNTLVKRDLQLFMKRLRKATGEGARFYACGEYGETFGRPHYHVLLFNRSFADQEYFSRTKRGDPLFTSRRLRQLWPQGNNIIGAVTFESCCYVASYVAGKITGDAAASHYGNREAEFSLMSRRPGLGSGYFLKYGSEVYRTDTVVMNGREIRPPRFYDVKYEVVDATRLRVLKRKRRRAAMLHKADSGTTRMRVREVVALRKLSLKSKEL